MVSPLSPRDARTKFPHAFLDLNNGAFERSPLCLLDRDLKPFYPDMPAPILALLYELIQYKSKIASDPDSHISIATEALKRALNVLLSAETLNYQLFIIVIRQFFLLLGAQDHPVLGHSSNGKELLRNRKELIPKAVIPKPLLPSVIATFIKIHEKQLFNSDTQFEHFLFLTSSFKAYGFDELFDAFYAQISTDMKVAEFDTQLNFILFWLNLLQKDCVEYNMLKVKEILFLREIKEKGIKRSVAFRYFITSLSHNEVDLSLLNVWLHVFSQLPKEDLPYIRNESMLFLYTRFSMIEPVIAPKRWYSTNEAVSAAIRVLNRHGLASQKEAPLVHFKRGVLRVGKKPLPEAALSELRKIPAVREVEACELAKEHRPLTETLNILKTAKFLLDGPVVDVDAMRGFVHYFHSFFPHGELTSKESKAAAKLYLNCFKEAVFDDKDRLYLELVYRNPFAKSLKKWNTERDWEKEACKLVDDYMTRHYPLHVVEKNIQALYRFFLGKKGYAERAPLILRDLYFEVQKKSTNALDKIKWCIKGLEHEPIDEMAISPFIGTLPSLFLANAKIPLKTHIRFITLMRKCYRLPNKIVEEWLKKFVRNRSNFKTITFAELLAIVELLKSIDLPLDDWKDIAVNLLSMPVRDALIATLGLRDSIFKLIKEINEKLFQSLWATHEAHKISGLADSFDVKNFAEDLREQFYLNCIHCFIKEIQNMEKSAVQSIIRFNDVLHQACLEDIMRKAVMASPNKLNAIEAQLTSCKLIDELLELLINKEEGREAVQKDLKLLGEKTPVSVKAGLDFLVKIRELKNRPLFTKIALEQFVQAEVINFSEWQMVVGHLNAHTYTFDEWKVWLSLLDVPIENNLSHLKSLNEAVSAIESPINGLIHRFKSEYKGDNLIGLEKDVICIKDKYFLNNIMNLEREYSKIIKNGNLVREQKLLTEALNYCYDQLVFEKVRAKAFIEKNCGVSILLAK